MNIPPIFYSLKQKHAFYLKQMQQQDSANNEIKEDIKHRSSFSTKPKDCYFLDWVFEQKLKLEKGRVLRERYRLRVRRYKEMIKNSNRDKNGSEIV